jgi:hypothetical protein
MQITPELIEHLLYEEEGTTLDFKRDQYPFEDASKDDKSELLKDILAFANAFRRSDAFILIGVEDVKGGRSNIVGVTSQLDDAKLQQFVNSKVQRPITFSYRDAVHDSRPIGIIHIPIQPRPIYTKADYGKVKKQDVIVRRGSSTSIANPDEIAQMGADGAIVQGQEPRFSLELLDRETGQSYGEAPSFKCTLLDVPPAKDIPDYSESNGRFLVSHGVNRDYYRDLVKFTAANQFLRSVSIALQNKSSVVANDVRLLIEVEDTDGDIEFIEESDLPREPVAHDLLFHHHIPQVNVHPNIEVTKKGDKWIIECSFGKLQPQHTARLSDNLYVGMKTSGDLTLDGTIYADNLSAPAPVRFTLHFETATRPASLDQIKEMETQRFLSTPEGKKLLEDQEHNSEVQ